MKYFIGFILIIPIVSCTYMRATFGNKNVYKTKSNLTLKKVYNNNRPATDLRDFTIVPNAIPTITKTNIQTNVTAVTPTTPSETVTTTTISTIPPTTMSTTIVRVPATATGTSTISSSTTLSVPAPLPTNNFIRY